MPIFTHEEFDNHEEVSFVHDRETGLKAIIAIHSTLLGPALGGCRVWPYESEAQALWDVLRLSRGMTYKAALAQLDFGGGKTVILKPPAAQEIPDKMILAFGRQVEKMGGRYITAEDVGTTPHHMTLVRQVTPHVVGLPSSTYPHRGSGDPSLVTAFGVFQGIKAAVRYQLGQDTLEGIKVAIQGLGHVGFELAKLLHQEGVILYVSDINPTLVSRAIETYQAVSVPSETIYTLDVDVFCPCALGGILNDQTIPYLKASIVAGAANNQLLRQSHGDDLRGKGILYAPDYVINAGGLMNVAYEYQGASYSTQTALQKVTSIYTTLMEIFERSSSKNCSTSQAADELAEGRLKGFSPQGSTISCDVQDVVSPS